MGRIQFRLSPELEAYVDRRAAASKIPVSEFIRLLIVLDMDKDKNNNNLALEEVTRQMADLKKSMQELERLRDELSKP
jgi:hypothetical protein